MQSSSDHYPHYSQRVISNQNETLYLEISVEYYLLIWSALIDFWSIIGRFRLCQFSTILVASVYFQLISVNFIRFFSHFLVSFSRYLVDLLVLFSRFLVLFSRFLVDYSRFLVDFSRFLVDLSHFFFHALFFDKIVPKMSRFEAILPTVYL